MSLQIVASATFTNQAVPSSESNSNDAKKASDSEQSSSEAEIGKLTMENYVKHSLSKCCCGVLIARLKMLKILIKDATSEKEATGKKAKYDQVVPDSDDSGDCKPPFCCDIRRDKIEALAKQYAHLDKVFNQFISSSESDASEVGFGTEQPPFVCKVKMEHCQDPGASHFANRKLLIYIGHDEMRNLKPIFNEDELDEVSADNTDDALFIHNSVWEHYLWQNKNGHSGKEWAQVMKTNMFKIGER